MSTGNDSPASPEQLAVEFKRSTRYFVLFAIILFCLMSACGLGFTVYGAFTGAASKQADATPTVQKTTEESHKATEQPSSLPSEPITATQSTTTTLQAGSASSKGVTATQSITATRQVDPVRVGGFPASLAASQQFFTLALLAGIAILFPAILLYAFALQHVPRLTKELDADLEKLGVGPSWGEVYAELARLDCLETSPGDTPSVAKSPETLEQGQPPTSHEILSMVIEPDKDPDQLKKLQDKHPKQYEIAKEWKREALDQRWTVVNKRYGASEFLVPVTLLMFFLTATVAWAFWPKGTYLFGGHFLTDADTLHTYFSEAVAAMPAALVAMLTAYLFVVYGLVRRYHRSDITPGAFWDAFKRLFVVFLIGLALTALFKAQPMPEDLNSQAWTFSAILIGVFAGIFPIHTLQLLARNAQAELEKRFDKRLKGSDFQQCEDLAQRLRPRHDLTLLDDLDAWDIERIEQEGVIGIQGMATVNIVDLVTWTPFPTTQIVDWVDQAILWMAAGAEPCRSYVGTLRAIGLRGASDLVDATTNPADKLRVVLAAQTLRGAMVEDPIPLAQLAGLRAQLKVKDAQPKVADVKGRETGASTDNIAAALEAVRVARWLVDDAYDRVKNGGDSLKDAVAAATDLQSVFKTVSAKAVDVEASLQLITDAKVTEGLATSLQALGQAYSDDVAAKANDLAKALDKVAQPLLEVEQKARELQTLAEIIEREAKKKQDERAGQPNPPSEVNGAADKFSDLKASVQAAKDRIKADAVLADSSEKIDALLKLLTDEGVDKPEKLLSEERLKKESQWTEFGNDLMAKAHADAHRLVEAATEMLALIEAGNIAIKKARTAATFPSATPPLTMEILETILFGLEHNPNLRRIHRYLREATAEIPPSMSRQCTNVEWVKNGGLPCEPSIMDATNMERQEGPQPSSQAEQSSMTASNQPAESVPVSAFASKPNSSFATQDAPDPEQVEDSAWF